MKQGNMSSIQVHISPFKCNCLPTVAR